MTDQFDPFKNIGKTGKDILDLYFGLTGKTPYKEFRREVWMKIGRELNIPNHSAKSWFKHAIQQIGEDALKHYKGLDVYET